MVKEFGEKMISVKLPLVLIDPVTVPTGNGTLPIVGEVWSTSRVNVTPTGTLKAGDWAPVAMMVPRLINPGSTLAGGDRIWLYVSVIPPSASVFPDAPVPPNVPTVVYVMLAANA